MFTAFNSFSYTKLCNDVLTRVRLPGAPEGTNEQPPRIYMAGQVMDYHNGTRFRIRFFYISEDGFVSAKVHWVGTRQDSSVYLGREGDFAEKLVRGDRYRI